MVFEKVAKIIADKIDCEVSEITPDTNFAELGIDSLDVTELVMNVEDEFKIEIPMEASMTKVSELVAKIEEKISNK